MQIAQLLDAEDGEQIVVFPEGFIIEADEVEILQSGGRVVLEPVREISDLVEPTMSRSAELERLDGSPM
ncbi:hypothetical protein [Phenylobacterium sp.]|jgi:virulence-associated protein VagC|uniref:hypothetical protein n=1 Tax=Phenylobacterium sp. TaxID=1871053 RepID=UPI0037C7FE64